MAYRWIGLVCLVLAGCSLAAPATTSNEEIKSEEILEAQTSTESLTPVAQESKPALETMPSPTLPNLGAAPELTNEVWLNVDQPLRLADLRGKVILLDMWTFG